MWKSSLALARGGPASADECHCIERCMSCNPSIAISRVSTPPTTMSGEQLLPLGIPDLCMPTKLASTGRCVAFTLLASRSWKSGTSRFSPISLNGVHAGLGTDITITHRMQPFHELFCNGGSACPHEDQPNLDPNHPSLLYPLILVSFLPAAFPFCRPSKSSSSPYCLARGGEDAGSLTARPKRV